MGYLDSTIYLELDNIYLIDFNTEFNKINDLPFSFLNSIDNKSMEYSKQLDKELLAKNIYFESIYTEELKTNKYTLSQKGHNYFENIYRLNPIADYEACQYYRLNHILSNISNDLENYCSIVLFHISFQMTYELKVKKLQEEINKILKTIELDNQSYSFSLLYNKMHREQLYVRGYIDFITTMVSDIEYRNNNSTSDIFKILLVYISNGFNNESKPIEKSDDKWLKFELNHFKLLMLRRLEKSLSLIDDFFTKDQIEISNPISLSLEDTSFFNKLSLILKDTKDRNFISMVLKNKEFTRSKAFYDNLFNYLNDNGNSSSRLTTVGSSTYVKMVKESYLHISNYSLSSNGLNEKWLNSFKVLDKK